MGQAIAILGAAVPCGRRQHDPVLNVLFARRRRRLLRFLTMGARNDPPSGTPRIAGRTLLSLPEDVMVRRYLSATHKHIRRNHHDPDHFDAKLTPGTGRKGPTCCRIDPAHSVVNVPWSTHDSLSLLCAQLVIICCLQHKEIGALFSVCRELRATVRLSASP